MPRGDHFRIGAIAITYTAALLIKLAEQGVVGLDEPISTWRPDLPYADKVTPRQLTSMTAGYPDYVTDPRFQEASAADVYKNGPRINCCRTPSPRIGPSNRARNGANRTVIT